MIICHLTERTDPVTLDLNELDSYCHSCQWLNDAAPRCVDVCEGDLCAAVLMRREKERALGGECGTVVFMNSGTTSTQHCATVGQLLEWTAWQRSVWTCGYVGERKETAA